MSTLITQPWAKMKKLFQEYWKKLCFNKIVPLQPIMKLKTFAAFWVLTSISFSCSSPNTPPKRLEQLATAYCECAATIAETDQKARLVNTDSPEELQRLLEQLQLEFEKSSTCLQPLLAELGPLLPEEIEQITPLLQKKCPVPASNKELLTELLCQ
jgi:hypothetical protein